MATKDVVFWGILKPLDEDSVMCQLLSGEQLFQVDFYKNRRLGAFVLAKLPEQGNEVSILGYLGEDPEFPSTLGNIIPSNVVWHHDIAVRAFEIYESRRGRSALDNWLAAERELLESPSPS